MKSRVSSICAAYAEGLENARNGRFEVNPFPKDSEEFEAFDLGQNTKTKIKVTKKKQMSLEDLIVEVSKRNVSEEHIEALKQRLKKSSDDYEKKQIEDAQKLNNFKYSI